MKPEIKKYLQDVIQCITEIRIVSSKIKSSNDIKQD